MSALDAVGRWPVPTAAAALVGPSGVLETAGDVDHRFRLASVTKPLSALAILVAVEEDAVSLDDPAEPELPGATLRHLLAHASGVAMDERRRQFGPAERRLYSNAGIELAAGLVERATGMAFADYLHEGVLDPLSLAATTLDGSPAHGGVSSVRDLARVAQELLSSTGLLSAATAQALRTVQFPGLRGVLPGFGGHDPNDWGLGVEIRGHKTPHWTGTLNAPDTYGHFGQSGTLVWVDPVARCALVALTDRDFGPWAKDAWPTLADDVLGTLRSP